MDCVTIISGGMDSTVLAHNLEKTSKYKQTLLSFNYGQKHKKELKFAAITASRLNCPHQIIDLTSLTRFLVSSSLTTKQEVPDGHYNEDSMKSTVVPNRNAIMLSIAFSVASSIGARIVACGVHTGDRYNYPDCRIEFAKSFQEMENDSLQGLITPTLTTPFINMTKADIARLGRQIKVPFEETWSCYKGGDKHCGRCGTCVERLEAMHEASVQDDTEYLDKEYWKQAVAEYKSKEPYVNI